MDIKDKLTRQLAIKNNIDPFGVKWGVSHLEGTSLYTIGKAPEDDDLSKPVEVPNNYPHINGRPSGMHGRYTRVDYAQQAIENYLREAWDFSDLQAQKNARKEFKEVNA